MMKEGTNIRVVVFLIDHVHLRPGRMEHIVVRALQPYCDYYLLSMHASTSATIRLRGFDVSGVKCDAGCKASIARKMR